MELNQQFRRRPSQPKERFRLDCADDDTRELSKKRESLRPPKHCYLRSESVQMWLIFAWKFLGID